MGSNDKIERLRWPLINSHVINCLGGCYFPEGDLAIVTEIQTLKLATSLLWILIHANSSGLTSLNSQVLCGSAVKLIFIQIGSISLHVGFRNSGRLRLCVVLSPLWGVLHYFPSATLEYPHIPSTFLSPPIQKHFITTLLFTFLQLVFNTKDCIKTGMW